MAPAQEAALLGAMVPPGATVKLDKHGTCRVITNMGNAPVMVPANTPEEWNVGQTAFLNHITAMNYLNVTACQLETSVDESTYCENSTDGVVGNCGYDAMVSGAGGSWGTTTKAMSEFYSAKMIGTAPVLLAYGDGFGAYPIVYSQRCEDAGLGQECNTNQLRAVDSEVDDFMNRERDEALAAGSYQSELMMFARADACILADAPGYYVLYEKSMFWQDDYILGAILIECK